MPIVTHLATGQQFTVGDASPWLNDGRYSVGADQQQQGAQAGTVTGMGYDPTVQQQQWLLNYLLQTGQYQAAARVSQQNADANTLQTQGGLANTAYGNQTQRLGVVGGLYTDLFGKPENLAAFANLERGQPHAGGLSFYRSLAGLSPLGEGNDYGSMHPVDPRTVISQLVGGVRGQQTTAEQHHGSAPTNRYGQPDDPNVYEHRGPNPVQGMATGGSTIVDHPSYMMIDGQKTLLGEYGRPERVTVTPLSSDPLPPRYYAGLADGGAPAGMAVGGQAVVYGGGPDAYGRWRPHPVTSAVGAPNSAGQVTVQDPHGGTNTVPYYEAQPFADPRLANTQQVQNLSPLELSLLGSTSAAQTGMPLSEWMALYKRSRPGFQQVSTQAAFSRAA